MHHTTALAPHFAPGWSYEEGFAGSVEGQALQQALVWQTSQRARRACGAPFGAGVIGAGAGGLAASLGAGAAEGERGGDAARGRREACVGLGAPLSRRRVGLRAKHNKKQQKQ
jgi:hypothetical protein